MSKVGPRQPNEQPWVFYFGPITNIGDIKAHLVEPPDAELVEWCRQQPGIVAAAQSDSNPNQLNVHTQWPERGGKARAEAFITALEQRLGYTLDRSGPPPSGLSCGPVI